MRHIIKRYYWRLKRNLAKMFQKHEGVTKKDKTGDIK